MGVDFNSAKDDLSMIVDTRNRTGYFASNRDGDDDIFSFKLAPLKKVDEKEKERQELSSMRVGKVLDKATGSPISGARVEISKPSNPMTGVYYYTNDTGAFHVARKLEADEQVKVTKSGYKDNTFTGANVAEAKSFEISMDSEAGSSIARRDFTTLYYDVNKSDLNSSMIEVLRPVVDGMKRSPDNIAYISGYADERGGDTYNYGLSLRRVEEVVNYLSSQGINKNRIQSSFFGAVKLSDKCRRNPKCVTDTDRENRRVEIYITNQK
jgi:outer membrane protein OmpA-like peptidoglycan-associated protein